MNKIKNFNLITKVIIGLLSLNIQLLFGQEDGIIRKDYFDKKYIGCGISISGTALELKENSSTYNLFNSKEAYFVYLDINGQNITLTSFNLDEWINLYSNFKKNKKNAKASRSVINLEKFQITYSRYSVVIKYNNRTLDCSEKTLEDTFYEINQYIKKMGYGKKKSWWNNS